MTNLLSRCDAEASGAAAAVVTFERITEGRAESLSFCQHHADAYGPALKADGWSPFQPTAGEQNTTSAARFQNADA
ncbi:hypothetical protein SEA_ARACELI_38 [Streptomyces phage Araceli]|nr:hypothetical protein SEA_HENOCCUS_38 [Streptomyces phage Henoccus]AWY07356.1 hypothetical protein SEA_JACKIEB_37 [Streptomyces phage JackieB]QFG07852.1 hypothetical protein SEA_ARACELI_38 [Streptomyces phage Araceli]